MGGRGAGHWRKGDVAESTRYHRAAMTDQLSLRLETDLPNLPDSLRPMQPRLLPEAFDSAEHLFEPSWGGLRALAYIGPADAPGAGEVRLVDETGRDVGGGPPRPPGAPGGGGGGPP